ncbi:hypothetical protein [Actinorugispora endophytica]|uniref:Uncharacterized protein n=1 Tax=Actinorugispora endophytica TaxID=1605990 RepID=A0A4R6USM6_9ACTN|nr:hypothetical protein [Actinorugispora endophytica]TDQ46374.1 hypothetical protein EV190_12561 [Actinorugispora endophytica]
MSNRPVGPASSDYERGVNYAEIYLGDDLHRSPGEVESLREALAACNADGLHVPGILAALASSGHPDHPTTVDPTSDFWRGFLDRVDDRRVEPL